MKMAQSFGKYKEAKHIWEKNTHAVVKVKDNCDCIVLCKPCATHVHIYSNVYMTVWYTVQSVNIHIVQVTRQIHNSPNSKAEEDGILFDNEYFLQVLRKEKMATKQDNLKLSNKKMKMAQMNKKFINTLNLQCTSIDASVGLETVPPWIMSPRTVRCYQTT